MADDYASRLRQSRAKAGESSVATKILDLMNKLRMGKGASSARRWVWELLQNAKDVAYEDIPTEVEIDFKQSGDRGVLEFRHNGKPFTSDNITFLIEQVSNKDREQEDPTTKRPGGKFGTGFLTTHLLSEKVEVEGVLKEEDLDYRKFKILLDRSGRRLPDVIDAVKRANDDCSAINNQPPFESYVRGGLNTLFRYKLDAKGIAVAEEGIEDIQRALPFTLAFLTDIAKVTLTSLGVVYEVEDEDPDDANVRISNVIKTTAHGKRETIRIVVFSKGDVSIALEVEEKAGKTVVKPRSKELPALFCEFPLVGSNAFEFPVVINSPIFNPIEPRSGIWLTDSKEEQVQENKRLIGVAVDLFSDLLKYAHQNEWGDTYNLFRIFPVSDNDWLWADWFDEQVLEPIRRELLFTPLLDIDLMGPTAILGANGESLICFPSSPSEEVRGIIWELSNSLIPTKLPPEDEVNEWYDVIWGDCPLITVEELTSGIQKKENLANLSTHFNYSEDDALAWLNQYYDLLYKEVDSLQFVMGNKYAVIPNQHGEFKLLKDLKIGEDVEEELKNVLEIFKTDIRKELVHTDVGTGDQIRYSVMNNASVIEQVNKALSIKGVDEPIAVACHYLTTLFPPKGTFSEERSFIYEVSKLLFPEAIQEKRAIDRYDADIWKEADKMQIKTIVKEISGLENLVGLTEQLLFESEDAAIKWLDSFVSFLIKHDLDSQLNLKKSPILPNQNGDFIYKDKVFLDDGETDEELKDMCAELGKDYREDLLDKDIYLPLADNRTVTKQMIADEIVARVLPKLSEINRSEEMQALFRRLYLYLNKNREEAEPLFGEFFKSRNRLCDDALVTDSIETTEALHGLLRKHNIPNLKSLGEMLESGQITFGDIPTEKTNITADDLARFGITSKEDLDHAFVSGGLGNYFHVSKPTVEMYEYAQSIIDRAKKRVETYLRSLPSYNLDNMEEVANTVLGGVLHNGIPVGIVVRPSDNGEVIIYYASEKDTLDFTNAELWVDDGVNDPKHLTFGKIFKITGINKIPVHGLYRD